MVCKYSDSDSICMLYDSMIEMPGVDKQGYCICENDENPKETCEEYVSC